MEQRYEELREESDNNDLLRRMVANMNGEICANCGSRECIEYHHIVPLKLGGTNRLTNYVALCHKCHQAAHYGRHIRNYQNKKVSGRPHKVDDETMKKAFDMFLNGEIGRRECMQMLKMAESSKLSDMSAYKRYTKEKGIKKVVNMIDMWTCKKSKRTVNVGDEVGTIIYIDGHEDVIIYKGNSKN